MLNAMLIAQATSLLQNKQAENSGSNLVKYTDRGRRKMKMQNYEIKRQHNVQKSSCFGNCIYKNKYEQRLPSSARHDEK